jgi:hypothetical protein
MRSLESGLDVIVGYEVFLEVCTFVYRSANQTELV